MKNEQKALKQNLKQSIKNFLAMTKKIEKTSAILACNTETKNTDYKIMYNLCRRLSNIDFDFKNDIFLKDFLQKD